MGEARRRGTYKQRRAMAIERDEKAYLVAKIESFRPKPKPTMTAKQTQIIGILEALLTRR